MNYSEVLKAEIAREHSTGCAFLKREALPKEVVKRLDAIPQDPAQQSADDKLMLQWMHADAVEVAKRQGYCGAS